MDAEDFNTDGLGNVNEVVSHVRQARKEGMGVISMKLAGEGTFQPSGPPDRDALCFPQRGRAVRYGGL